MIVYVLRSEGGGGDPRMRALTAPEEAPVGTWDGSGWVVRTKLSTTRDALLRRYRFAVVGEENEAESPRPWELPTASETDDPPEVNVEDGSSPFYDFRRWLARRPDPEQIDCVTTVDAVDLVRRPFGVGAEAARVARSIAADGGLDDVTIVLVCHGWGPFEQGAAERAIDTIRTLGPKARLSIVQNRDEGPDGLASTTWAVERARHPIVQIQTTENNGFAAACNAGARLARTRFLLLTQPDAWFGADAVRLAVALSLSLAAQPSGGGRPAVIGPSGGYIPSWTPVFTEEGRNVERFGVPVPVEWVGGYWMLVERSAWREAEGMWSRSFLYCEEPDLCLRLAAIGARSFVWGDLPVNHQRGGTIKRRLSREQAMLIHDDAREQFRRRWSVGVRDLGKPHWR